MTYRLILPIFVLAACAAGTVRADDSALEPRLDRLEAEVTAAEDLAAIKHLQRAYGYYVDKGMWEDVADLYADDAVANYPAGVYVGKDSIRAHLYMNVGGGKIGENGLPDGRVYDHMNIQPVVHLDPGGTTAKGRWRAFAMFGGFGGGAVWAEGVYEMTYVKQGGAWKIKTLDYYSGFGAPYATGWVAPEQPRGAGTGRPRTLAHPADRPRDTSCEGFPAACLAPFHYANPGTPAGGRAWTTVDLPSGKRADARDRAADLAHRATLLRDEQSIENLQRIYGYYYSRRMWDDVADLFAADGTIEMGLRGVYAGKARVRQFLDLLGPAGLEDGGAEQVEELPHARLRVHAAQSHLDRAVGSRKNPPQVIPACGQAVVIAWGSLRVSRWTARREGASRIAIRARSRASGGRCLKADPPSWPPRGGADSGTAQDTRPTLRRSVSRGRSARIAGVRGRPVPARALGRYPAGGVRRAETRSLIERLDLPGAALLHVSHLVDAFGPGAAAAAGGLCR